MRVLIVEDDVITVEWESLFFVSNDIEVATAMTVAEAIARLNEFHPDVIVSDVGLPGEDGFELMARIRSADATAMIPVVAVSGYNLTESERGLFSAYLSKPVDPEELLNVVRGLAGRKNGSD